MAAGSDRALRRLLLLTWVVLLVAVAWQFLPLSGRSFSSQDAEPRPVTARGNLAADEQATIELFERASPSVVYISTRRRVIDYWSRDVLSVPQGTGSGFIWDDRGHVVTNFHVLKGASEAEVRLNDGRTYRAGLVGASPMHDLAVLRINVAIDRPPAVPIGSSSDLKVGQTVFAIGNPFGLDYTLTSGLISALDRSLSEGDVTIRHLIQTDAAINPGNSGGPLLDSAGRLIGINTAIYSPSGAYAGIGFAVPVDTVNRIVPQLIAEGEYRRPSMGVIIDERLNELIANRFGINGVVVLKVEPGSSAEAAGLRGTTVDRNGALIVGDIIVAIDGVPVEAVSDLLRELDDRSIGDEVMLTVVRGGRQAEIPIVLQLDR
ncbi:MAG: trypsin-like peptidase domain-containing protein [Woeseiaceae bacterium]|nr:trypsin-like peptidase domain-containing protein [Woeseiaceae bacterium]